MLAVIKTPAYVICVVYQLEISFGGGVEVDCIFKVPEMRFDYLLGFVTAT